MRAVWLLFALLAQEVETPKVEISSVYVTAQDGTRLAVDVYLPAAREPDQSHPVLLELTRYWRSAEDPDSGKRVRQPGRLGQYFLDHGYALAKVDVRGSGASFGTRPAEYGRQEVRDGHDVVEWLVDQPWCDGNVGAFGTSYTGTTAEMLCAVRHPAVKAVVPGWSDFDVYQSPVRPYGLLASGFIGEWSQMVGWMDDGNAERLGGLVSRVDADEDGSLRDEAVADHAANPDVLEGVRRGEYRDDAMATADRYIDLASIGWKQEIEESGVPMLVFASWLDAGTAEGALLRYQHYSNPQKVVILASNHGGGLSASPYVTGEVALPKPSVQEQFDLRLSFFDHYLKGQDQGVEDWPGIRYFNLGEEELRETEVWPPLEVQPRVFYLGAGAVLSSGPPGESEAADEYKVDFGVTSGRLNRWFTQMGRAVVGLDHREVMDQRMLTYTSAPLTEDLQVTGIPVVTLYVSSTHTDGAFLAYLEDVDSEGRSRYITEGGLRAIHRKVTPDPQFPEDAPTRTFARADSLPLVPGEVAELTFKLWPTSVLFRRGHRVRLAFAGADQDTFDRVPEKGDPTWSVRREAAHASSIALPVIASENR